MAIENQIKKGLTDKEFDALEARFMGSPILKNTQKALSEYVGRRIEGRVYTKQDAEKDSKMLVQQCCFYIDSLVRTGLIEKSLYEEIANRILTNIQSIDYVPEDKRGVYGYTSISEKKLYINPDLKPDKKLLYVFHELGHVVLYDGDDWLMDIDNKQSQYAYYGFMVNEEALVQNIAEECFYDQLNVSGIHRSRPKREKHPTPILPKDVYVVSNFDYYGEFQPVAIAFGRTLRGVGTSVNDSDDKIMFDFCRRALKGHWRKSIIEEYEHDNQSENLFSLLVGMAHIYIQQGRTFGAFSRGGESVITVVNGGPEITETIKNLSPQETFTWYKGCLDTMKKLEDYRPELAEENVLAM